MQLEPTALQEISVFDVRFLAGPGLRVWTLAQGRQRELQPTISSQRQVALWSMPASSNDRRSHFGPESSRRGNPVITRRSRGEIACATSQRPPLGNLRLGARAIVPTPCLDRLLAGGREFTGRS